MYCLDIKNFTGQEKGEPIALKILLNAKLVEEHPRGDIPGLNGPRYRLLSTPPKLAVKLHRKYYQIIWGQMPWKTIDERVYSALATLTMLSRKNKKNYPIWLKKIDPNQVKLEIDQQVSVRTKDAIYLTEESMFDQIYVYFKSSEWWIFLSIYGDKDAVKLMNHIERGFYNPDDTVVNDDFQVMITTRPINDERIVIYAAKKIRMLPCELSQELEKHDLLNSPDKKSTEDNLQKMDVMVLSKDAVTDPDEVFYWFMTEMKKIEEAEKG